MLGVSGFRAWVVGFRVRAWGWRVLGFWGLRLRIGLVSKKAH